MYQIKNWRENTSGGRKKGWFTLVIGDFEIDDFSLVEGEKGNFIGFPQRSYEKDGVTKYISTTWIKDDKRRYAFQDWALKELDKIVGIAPQPTPQDDDIPF